MLQKPTLIKLGLLLALLVLLPAVWLYDATLQPPEIMYDFVIRGATVVDGSGRARFRADVAILGERIAKVGSVPIRSGRTEIRGAGYILTPGFVDIHSHVDMTVRAHPQSLAALHQGITTVIVGQDGFCGYPLPCRYDHPRPPPVFSRPAPRYNNGDCRAGRALTLKHW